MDEPLITFSKIEGTDTLIADAFSDYGGMPKSVVECPSALTVCAMVEAGIGVALAQPISMTMFRNSSIVSIPFRPVIETTMCAYWTEASQAEFDLTKLISLSKKHAQALYQQYPDGKRIGV